MAFKPNIYPIMYWALAYGVAAGLLLFVVFLLSRYITLVWFPVFLAGLIWGGMRNYRRQKQNWEANTGTPPSDQGVVGEFREAVTDIAGASQELFNQEAAADESSELITDDGSSAVAAEPETVLPPEPTGPDEQTPPSNQPPVPPAAPPVS